MDDQADTVDCLCMLLEESLPTSSAAWVIEAVSSPLTALQRLQLSHFDVVITDVLMPHMSGTKLMREAHSIQPDLKVILISGQAPPSDRAGAFAFLPKPFRVGRLVKLIERALTDHPETA